MLLLRKYDRTLLSTEAFGSEVTLPPDTTIGLLNLTSRRTLDLRINRKVLPSVWTIMGVSFVAGDEILTK